MARVWERMGYRGEAGCVRASVVGGNASANLARGQEFLDAGSKWSK